LDLGPNAFGRGLFIPQKSPGMLMHTRAFSNVLNELLIKIEGIYIREREREREQVLGRFTTEHF
jgi:hypothetical protein